MFVKVSSGWREKVATLCAVGEGGEGGVSRSKEGESRGDEEGGRGEAGEEDKGEQEESEGVAESVSDKQTISEVGCTGVLLEYAWNMPLCFPDSV